MVNKEIFQCTVILVFLPSLILACSPKSSSDVNENDDAINRMQQDAVDYATQALEKYNIEMDIAAYIKKEFDKKYNPTWHCIVGRNFGSYVTHETRSVASQRINSNPQ